jgi:hypothetical protein
MYASIHAGIELEKQERIIIPRILQKAASNIILPVCTVFSLRSKGTSFKLNRLAIIEVSLGIN